MSYRETYDMLDRASKRFKLEDNTKSVQRTASSIVNNSNLDANKHALKINELVKDIQRVGSISPTSKVDEAGLLKSFLSTYQ